MSMWCLFCFTNDTLNLCQLPEWNDEYNFVSNLLGCRIDPKFKSIPLCDECLETFRNLGHLREEFFKIQAQIREVREEIKGKINGSEPLASIEVAVQSISKQTSAGSSRGGTSAIAQQLKCTLDFRKWAMARITQEEKSPAKGGKKRKQNDGENDVLQDFDCQYFDDVEADPDWMEDVPQSPPKSRKNTSPAKPKAKSQKEKLTSGKIHPTSPKRKNTANEVEDDGIEYPLQEDGTKPWKPRRLKIRPELTIHEFKCNQCPRSFKSFARLECHTSVHTGKENYFCDFCKLGFRSTHSLKKHNFEKHGARLPHKCDQCDISYAVKSALDRHIKSSHNKDCIIDKSTLTCHKCGKKDFTSLRRLLHHRNSHLRHANPVTCCFCLKKLSQRVKLMSHLIKRHRNEKDSPNGFKCSECNGEYSSAIAMITHIWAHSFGHNQDNNCKRCNLELVTRDRYNEHNEQVHGEIIGTKIACEKCGMFVLSERHLKAHSKLHQEIINRPAFEECLHCKKQVKRRWMYKHLKSSHWDKMDNIQPRKCFKKHCELTFTVKSDLEAHESTHGAVSCQTCGKTYMRESVLKKHINRKHGTSNTTGQAQGPINLSNVPADEIDLWGTQKRRRVCRHCFKSCKNKSALERHVELVHFKLPLAHSAREEGSKPKFKNAEQFKKMKRIIQKTYKLPQCWKVLPTRLRKNVILAKEKPETSTTLRSNTTTNKKTEIIEIMISD